MQNNNNQQPENITSLLDEVNAKKIAIIQKIEKIMSEDSLSGSLDLLTYVSGDEDARPRIVDDLVAGSDQAHNDLQDKIEERIYRDLGFFCNYVEYPSHGTFIDAQIFERYISDQGMSRGDFLRKCKRVPAFGSYHAKMSNMNTDSFMVMLEEQKKDSFFTSIFSQAKSTICSASNTFNTGVGGMVESANDFYHAIPEGLIIAYESCVVVLISMSTAISAMGLAGKIKYRIDGGEHARETLSQEQIDAICYTYGFDRTDDEDEVLYTYHEHTDPSVEDIFKGVFALGVGLWAAYDVSRRIYAKYFKRTDNGNLVGIETNPGPTTPTAFKRGVVEAQGLFDATVGLDQHSTDILQKLVNSLETVGSNSHVFPVEHSFPVVENLFSSAAASLPSMGEAKLIFALIVTTIVSAYFVGSQHAKVVQMFTSAWFTYTFPNPRALAAHASLVVMVQAYGRYNSGTIQAQSGVSNGITAVIALIYFESMGRAMSKDSISGFLKTVGDMPKMRDGVAFLVDYILTVLQKFCDHMQQYTSMELPAFKTSLFPEIEQLEVRINDLHMLLRRTNEYNWDNGMLAFELESEARRLHAKIPSSREYAEYKRAAYELMNSMKPITSKMARSNIVGNGPRKEPLGVIFSGPSGVGKSTAVTPTIMNVLAQVLPADKKDAFLKNPADFIYNYIPEMVYWDAYHNQFAVTVDELGCYNDVAGSPDPTACAILRMINPANLPCHMASVDDKGNTNFNSSLIFATTNRTHFDFKSMYCSEAFCRRWDLSFVVVPKEEYCLAGTVDPNDLWKRRLDMGKLPEKMTLDVNEYYPWTFEKDKSYQSGSPLNYVQVVKLIVMSYKAKMAKGEMLLAYNKEAIEAGLAQRVEAQAGETIADELARLHHLSKAYAVEVMKDLGEKATMSRDYVSKFAVRANEMLVEVLPEPGSIFEKLKDFACNRKYLTGVAAALAMCVGLWSISRMYLVENEPVAEEEYDSQSGDVHSKARQGPKNRSGRVIIQKRANGAQSGIDSSCLQIADKITKGNCYRVSLKRHEDEPALGFVTFLGGRVAMLPEHFVEAVDESIATFCCEKNPLVILTRVGAENQRTEVLFNDIRLVCFADEAETRDDVCYGEFPKVVHNHPDLTKFIRDDKPLPTKFRGAFLRPHLTGGYTLIETDVVQTGAHNYDAYEYTGLRYPIATNMGDCGSILFDVSGVKPCIVGFHTSGSKGHGFSTRIHLQDIKQMLRGVEVVVAPDESEPSVAQLGPNFLPTREVRRLGVATKNQVVESPLHEAWGPSDYLPSALRPVEVDGKKVDPWVQARTKYSKEAKAYNLFQLDLVTQSYKGELSFACTHDEHWMPRMYTFEEAVAGIPGIDFCNGIPRNTSAGYPFSLDVKGKGKSDFFGFEGEYDFSSKACVELKAHVLALIARMEKGERPEFMFADFLKDERLPKAKVQAGKTRLISASPLDFTIICRMYYGDVVRWMMSNRIHNSVAVGVNPYCEWDGIKRHLESVGKSCIFGDFSGYDGSLSQILMYSAGEVFDGFYHNASESEKRVRKVIFEDIVNSRHVTVGPNSATSTLYEWKGSNPSGNFLTTMLNSVCNILATRYSMITCLLESQGYEHLNAPYEAVIAANDLVAAHARMITFGDDGGICVGEVLKPFITQGTLTRAFGKIGFVYTSEDKKTVHEGHRDISECTFLKRGFVYNEEARRLVAPLELAVILESPYWTKSNAPPGTVEQTLETCLLELSMHGKDVYEKHAKTMIQASVEKLNHTPVDNYRYWLTKALHREGQY